MANVWDAADASGRLIRFGSCEKGVEAQVIGERIKSFGEVGALYSTLTKPGRELIYALGDKENCMYD